MENGQRTFRGQSLGWQEEDCWTCPQALEAEERGSGPEISESLEDMEDKYK